jgi:broad specificity phosphatase PhoE
MAGVAQQVFLVRHGETEWSLGGQHTGRTDIVLTANGRRQAERLAPVLDRERFGLVLTSPLRRARETCELAGLAADAGVDPNLCEWDYGDYEGLTPAEIRDRAPDWMVFRDGCPGGESPEQVGARVDLLIDRVRSIPDDVALFAHGHLSRVFAARWLGLPVEAGRHFLLDTATLCILSFYHGAPAVRRWNVPVA